MKIYRLIGMLLIGLSLAACNATVSVDPTTSSGSGSGGTDGGSTPPPPDSTTPPPDNTTPPPPDSGTPPPADTTPPTVLGTKPIDNGTAPSSSTTITVTFDEAIDPASVTASTVSLSSSSGNLSVTESVSGDKLVITSATPFQNGISYTATVAGTVTDTAGNAMGTDYIWHFVAADDLCAGIYQSGYDPVYGMDTTPPPPMSKPAKGVPYADPAYGTCIIRATDHSVEPPAGFARNDYSRRQPFNSDDSMYLVYDDNGYFHIYDAHDLSYIRRLNLGGGSTEPQWSPTDPDILYVFPNHGGMTISKYNVLTDQRTVVADFTKLASIAGHPGMTSLTDIWPSAARVWTRSEGSPSRDYRYWGLMVETDSFQSLGLITYDMQTNTVTGVYDFATDGNGIGRPDHVSMSPSGKYVVPSWNGPGQDCSSRSALGTVNNPCGLMSFSRDFSSAVGLAVRGPHSDIAIDATGNDVIVISNYNT
ncbi:MAG: Ig-like domain-containing protein, partial [Gammaproteobacteria bacterium]